MHKLNELARIVEEKIGSLKEEVEIGTNVKLNTLYIAERRNRISPMDHNIVRIGQICSS
jgi:hypothetical protein